MSSKILGQRQLLDASKFHAIHRMGSLHARPRRAARSTWGARVGLTARQRLAAWQRDRNAEIIREARALGVWPDRPRSRKWIMERIKEGRRAQGAAQ